MCRLFADNTRIRLLHLLETDAFSVAELAAITQLAQPRVSTHLAKLKEASLVQDRRSGVSVYYRASETDTAARLLWQSLSKRSSDPLLDQDQSRVAAVLATRAKNQNWADTVAGDMERHYSPGRTWEATTRTLVQLLELGDVLDIASGDGVTAELLAPQAKSMLCIDISKTVVAAGNARTKHLNNVEFQHGDMHNLNLDDQSFDTVLMLQALTYATNSKQVLHEVARVLKPGGRLLSATLLQHQHKKLVAPFGHINQGFTHEKLQALLEGAGFDAISINAASTERRPPHFTVLTFIAKKA